MRPLAAMLALCVASAALAQEPAAVGDGDNAARRVVLPWGSQGAFTLPRVDILGMKCTEIKGDVAIERRPIQGQAFEASARRADPDATHLTVLRFTNLTGKLYGGWFTGELTVFCGQGFAFDLHYNNVDLHLLAQDVAVLSKNLTGKLQGHLNLTNAGLEPGCLNGRGSVTAAKGDFWQMPGLFQLFYNVFDFGPIGGGYTFTDLSASFNFEGHTVDVFRIECRGDAGTITGSGRVGLDKSLDLLLRLTMEKRMIDLIPILGEFVSAFMKNVERGIFKVTIKGSMDKPFAYVTPFGREKGPDVKVSDEEVDKEFEKILEQLRKRKEEREAEQGTKGK